MARAPSSTGLEMGDRGFLRVNARLEGEQLQPGELALSENGRMDRGAWQQRLGIQNLSGTLQNDADPLLLPFFLVDTPGGLGSGVTVDISGALTPDATGSLLYAGTFFGYDEFTSTGGFDYATPGFIRLFADLANSVWTLEIYPDGTVDNRKGWVSADLPDDPWDATGWGPEIFNPPTGTPVVAEGAEALTASRVDELVTITVANHHFEPGLSGYLGVEGLTGSEDANGVHFITVVNASVFTLLLAGATGSETYTGTGLIRSVIDDGAASRIWGSCLFSDPSSNNDESIVIAASGKAVKIPIDGSATSDVAYPTGLTLDAKCHLLQDFDRITLFRQGGSRSWEWFPRGRVVSAASLTSNVVTVTLKNHGLSTGDTVTLADIGFATTNPNGNRVVTGTPSKDTFTFALTGGNETYTNDTGTATAGFTLCQGGAYTQPQVFEKTGTDVQISSGLLTMTGLTNSTVDVGDTIRIYSTDVLELLEFVGRSFVAVTATASSIAFYIPAPDLSTIGTGTLSIGKEVSQGSGFIHMPAPPWGVNHQRRRFVPYWYSTGGTALSPTYTDRNARDEIVISDVLDGDTYDVLTNQFRVTAGTADFTVGMQPFYDDTMLVFQRNSIHGIFGVSGSLADAQTRELTREIGLLARGSLAAHGAQIMFLSDNGVYQIGFIDQYNLRGVEVPMSEAIQPYIDRINPDLAADAVGIYFANRYYLAVPLDSAKGAGDATGNNKVLVYNFLNRDQNSPLGGWESVDSVSDSRWSILNFHIARAGERNDLYVVDSLGGVHRYDAMDRDSDYLTLAPSEDPSYFPVQAALQTREYDGETLERKRFIEVQTQIEASSQPVDAEFFFATEDPDSTVDLGTLSAELGEPVVGNGSASSRKRVGGYRGHGGTVTITPTAGRPKIKSVKVTASVTNKATTWQK